MKLTTLTATLCAVLLLSGCASWMEQGSKVQRGSLVE